jgi:hypothetical protein
MVRDAQVRVLRRKLMEGKTQEAAVNPSILKRRCRVIGKPKSIG